LDTVKLNALIDSDVTDNGYLQLCGRDELTAGVTH